MRRPVLALTVLGLLACFRPLAAEEALKPQEVAPGVFALASPASLGSANAGWIALDGGTLLVGPPELLVPRLLEVVDLTTRSPVRGAVLTRFRDGDRNRVLPLLAKGVAVWVPAGAARGLQEGLPEPEQALVRSITGLVKRVGERQRVLILPVEGSAAGGAAVFAQSGAVLFAGEACVNGPRAPLAGTDTRRLIESLAALRKLEPKLVVPGYGSTAGPEALDRFARFLAELRRQVAHGVAQGWPLADVRRAVRIEPEWLVWPPYDHPDDADVAHVHAEMTVPRAPFAGSRFDPADPRPRALVVFGDRPHEPGRMESPLQAMLEESGFVPHLTVDPRALSAAALAKVRLLVILRDGYMWPEGPEKPHAVWMTREQEEAVVAFVEAGGAFLALHNATGLYSEGGPYLKLLGGTYNGHGPLERFRVQVADREHPITQGVEEYEVADEQHTPVPDAGSVHIVIESLSADGVKAAAGWAREAGKGRVAYLANGHTREALDHPQFQRLVRNAARWCARLEPAP